MQNFFLRFFEDESGVTAIEYSLVCSLISVAIIGAITIVGSNLLGIYTAITTALTPAL